MSSKDSQKRWYRAKGRQYRFANAARIREVKRVWYERTRERRLFVKREWRRKNHQRHLAAEAAAREKRGESLRKYQREWKRKNWERLRWYSLKKKYGITREGYESLWRKQKGRCGICRCKPSLKQKWLDVDHCHQSKKIRLLLCHNCNMGLGSFRDNLELLEKAVDYLRQWQ